MNKGCSTCEYGSVDTNCEYPPCYDCESEYKIDGANFSKWESASYFDVTDERPWKGDDYV